MEMENLIGLQMIVMFLLWFMSEAQSWTPDAYSLMDMWAQFQITLVHFSLSVLQASLDIRK